MESPTSCASTQRVESSHGAAVSCVAASYEIDLAQLALSCHFALDLLCYKEGDHDFA